MTRPAELATRHGTVRLPAFFPDATRAVVRTVDAQDLEDCGIQGLIVNTFHVTSTPGVGLVKSQGGVHDFMGWERPVITDSGGFQAMSMIRENARYGTISDAGITFSNFDAKNRKKLKLTPQKCIQIQFDLGSDVMMCLDDCPHPEASKEQVEASVRRTVKWAKQCKKEFERQVEARKLAPADRPMLFGIIQGGYSKHMRWQCAEALIEIGFDGYGFGGWPLTPEGDMATSILDYTAQLMPDEGFKYAMGVGNPQAIVRCVEMGYDLFDCVLPTRDARHERLYCADSDDPASFSYLYIEDDKHKRDARPISEQCDCACCRRYSRSYLHHLFQIQDGLAGRLATIHNLRFYARLMERLRDK